MEIHTALTGRRFDNSPWQISIPTVPWNFPGKSPFFFLVISPQYIWGELGRTKNPSRPMRIGGFCSFRENGGSPVVTIGFNMFQ